MRKMFRKTKSRNIDGSGRVILDKGLYTSLCITHHIMYPGVRQDTVLLCFLLRKVYPDRDQDTLRLPGKRINLH
jgi:hypothetical protein